MSTHENDAVRARLDGTVATLTLSRKGGPNIIDETFARGLDQALDWALAQPDLSGVVIDSDQKTFCAGADIDGLYTETDPAAMLDKVLGLDALYRKIETSGVPVVAAIAGAALGGGYELCLACHHRIALDDPRIQIGLPEVQLGVFPGAGGTQRLPRLIGIQPALEIILQAKQLRPAQALKAGLVDALAPDAEALRTAALAFVAANPKAKQPWDSGKRPPGPRADSNDGRNLFMAACAMLRKKTAGVFPGPERAISAMQEGMELDFDSGVMVEARYFTELAVGDQAKDMIRTLWHFRNAAKRHLDLPATDDIGIQKVAILGAGMMGAGLAFVSAKAGFDVVLRDIDHASLDAAMAHVDAELAKRKHLDDDARAQIRGRVTPTLELAEVGGADLVIEAVFEDKQLKHSVTRETEALLADEGIWASNTSALPITDLAEASAHAERFIGLHFFSPVEKMPLVEIIRGRDTNERTVARSLAYARRIDKLPIVVGDGYGFFTTRVFSAYILEAATLVAQGHDPVLVEWAARQLGMVVPPLQVFDEVTLSLGIKAVESGRDYLDAELAGVPGVGLLRKLVDAGRAGKAAGAGFYEYREGRRRGLWKGLAPLVDATPELSGVGEIADRLLYAQVVQAVSCLEEGIVERARDAEVGAIFGIGFCPNFGGPLGVVDRLGAAEVVERLDELREREGARFAAPALLREMASSGARFFPAPSEGPAV